MKRHPTTASIGTRRKNGSAIAGPARATQARRAPVEPKEASLVLTSVGTWTHRLNLTGELTHRSAHALELEIERLCEQGVTEITLDLRELTHIDPVGVAVIAFRCGLCEKRGYGFTLLRGRREVHRAFEQAGLCDLLPFRDAESLDDGPLSDPLRQPALENGGGLESHPEVTSTQGA